MNNPTSHNRRHFLKRAGAWGALPWLWPAKRGYSQSPPHRYVQFFLRGGWDSALATDPVVGSKAASTAYAAAYQGFSTTVVPGKSNLIVGAGMANAASGFANINTGFVNGLHVEVTAHELAVNYLLSGQLSLSRSREFPAIVASMGAQSKAFPPHLVLGGGVPLGETRISSPPMWAQSADMLSAMLQGPYNPHTPKAVIDRAHALLANIDQGLDGQLASTAIQSVQAWNNASSQVQNLYDSGLGEQLTLDDAIKSRYNFSENWSDEALIAATFLSLKSGLTPFITTTIGSYDTHSNHLALHLPQMQNFASRLNTFIDDLRNTADPSYGTMSLAETTTILVVSEFVRTPHFNAAAGTDHWKSASAILLGKGVADNRVTGATGDDGLPLGWVGGSSTAFSQSSQILPDQLAAAIVKKFGFPDLSQSLSGSPLDDVFS